MKGKKKKIWFSATALCLTLACAATVACAPTSQSSSSPGAGSIVHEQGELYVTGIEIVQQPNRTQYIGGEESFDSTGMVVKATWNDGYVEENVSSTKYYYEPSGILPEGTTFVTVYYGDASAKVSVSTGATRELYVKQIPIKTDYVVGEQFDPSGLILGYIVNNVKKDFDGYDVSKVTFPRKALQKTDEYVTVEYEGMQVNVPITVRAQSQQVELEDMSVVSYAGGAWCKGVYQTSEGKWRAGKGATDYDTYQAAYDKQTEATKAQLEQASGNNFVAFIDKEGASFTVTIENATTSKVNLYIRGASNNVGMYMNEGHSKPVQSYDMDLTEVMNLSVNGTAVAIDSRAILPGLDNNNVESHYVWTNWATVFLGEIDLKVGQTNTLKFTFNLLEENAYQWGTAMGQYDYILLEDAE